MVENKYSADNKDTIKLSVIILNYNGKDLLGECIDAVKKQSVLPDEILVLDNNSTDGSVEYLNKEYPDVVIVESGFNAGTAQGSNIAAKHARGEKLIFMSNDIVMDKDCIKYLLKATANDSSIGICTSVLVNYYKDELIGIKLIDNAGGFIDKFGFPVPFANRMNIKDIPEQKEVFFSYGGCFIINKDLFEQVKGFDDKFFTLNDDVDLSWRVRLLGYKVIYNRNSFVYHHVSATLKHVFVRARKRYWSERNIFRTMLKNYSGLSLLAILPVYFILLAAEAIYYLIRLKFPLCLSIVKAFFWNIINLADTLRLRSYVQKGRRVSEKVITSLFLPGSEKVKSFQSLKQAI